MLHAAYRRLSASDRQEVDRLLEAEYAALKSDKDLAERMAFYERTEPGERDNELHSVIGVEVSKISPELENYYKRYFVDRSKVVTLYQQYDSVFESLKARANELNEQINRLSTVINDSTKAYNAEAAAVERAINSFNTKAKQGDFGSQAEFSAERQRLFARTTALENLRAEINSNVTKYNELVVELNGIATETEELNRSLDSTLAPPPSL
jgi:chromosome segregation ATPase